MVLYLLIRNFKIFTKVISVKITKTAKQLVKYKLFFNANTETSDDKRRQKTTIIAKTFKK